MQYNGVISDSVSQSAIIYFNLDLSGNIVSAGPAPLDNSDGLIDSFIEIQMEKTLFFKDGFSYTVIPSTDNSIESIVANENDNIDSQYMMNRALGNFTMAVAGPITGNAVTMNYTFEGTQKSFRFSYSRANGLMGLTQLGNHILYIAACAIAVKPPSMLTQVFANANELAFETSQLIVQAIKNTLQTQTCQDAIFHSILEHNGPIANLSPGEHQLPISSEMTPIKLIFKLSNLHLNLSFFGGSRVFSMNDIPFVINLI